LQFLGDYFAIVAPDCTNIQYFFLYPSTPNLAINLLNYIDFLVTRACGNPATLGRIAGDAFESIAECSFGCVAEGPGQDRNGNALLSQHQDRLGSLPCA
jgi:hypothetical protein